MSIIRRMLLAFRSLNRFLVVHQLLRIPLFGLVTLVMSAIEATEIDYLKLLSGFFIHLPLTKINVTLLASEPGFVFRVFRASSSRSLSIQKTVEREVLWQILDALWKTTRSSNFSNFHQPLTSVTILSNGHLTSSFSPCSHSFSAHFSQIVCPHFARIRGTWISVSNATLQISQSRSFDLKMANFKHIRWFSVKTYILELSTDVMSKIYLKYDEFPEKTREYSGK